MYYLPVSAPHLLISPFPDSPPYNELTIFLIIPGRLRCKETTIYYYSSNFDQFLLYFKKNLPLKEEKWNSNQLLDGVEYNYTN